MGGTWEVLSTEHLSPGSPRSPISESRRVLQESCEFFLKHNSKVKHKKKPCKPGSHKLKVISKSMGTSTGVTAYHGTSAVAIADQDFLGQETATDIQTSPEVSVRKAGTAREQDLGESTSPTASSRFVGDTGDRKSQATSVQDRASVSDSVRSEGR